MFKLDQVHGINQNGIALDPLNLPGRLDMQRRAHKRYWCVQLPIIAQHNREKLAVKLKREFGYRFNLCHIHILMRF